MAEFSIKNLNEIILSSEGVTSIVFPGIIPVPKEKGIELEIYINIAYGKVIPEVCWTLQENIKNYMQLTDFNLLKANIHVEGIDLVDLTEEK